MSEPLLRVENLRTWFASEAGPIRAVDGVDFELEKGRTLGVVGESGSGKTVLTQTLLGLASTKLGVPASSLSVSSGVVSGGGPACTLPRDQCCR